MIESERLIEDMVKEEDFKEGIAALVQKRPPRLAIGKIAQLLYRKFKAGKVARRRGLAKPASAAQQ